MLHKIVINNCYGGFSLSTLAIKRYFSIKTIILLKLFLIGFIKVINYKLFNSSQLILPSLFHIFELNHLLCNLLY